MLVLVVNAGSRSVKLRLVGDADEVVAASMVAARPAAQAQLSPWKPYLRIPQRDTQSEGMA